MDRAAIWAKARLHEEAFRNILCRMGFEQSFSIKLEVDQKFTNIAVHVLDLQQAAGSGPRLLIPVDPQPHPDEPAIEAVLARSIGLMLAGAEMYEQLWVDTYGDLLSRASKRPEASLQCLDFMAGPRDGLLLHAEFLRLNHNFSKIRSRRIASDIQELVGD